MATGNPHKITEAANVLATFGIKLEHYPLDRIEIQADNLTDIASYSLNMIKENIPVCVEDAGLFIDYFDGFPGPYSSYVLKRLGNVGILKLMEGEKHRKARYVSAVAYRDDSGMHIFQGMVEGEISHVIHGCKGFGYDPIFIPSEGDGRTFGEFEDIEKNLISHRGRSFTALGKWLIGLQ
jgi:XTP/dITP diphosphohydrolase